MTEVEPYKLSEIFSLIPEFDGDQIFLNTFLNACSHAFRMCIEDQKILLTLHIKNKLRGKAAQLINSRDVQTWPEIKQLLTVHFGDSRDLTSLIQDLQKFHQLPNENPLTFVSRLQTHNAKMHACVQQQNLSAEQKEAQEQLIETMTLNTLLTGLEPRLGQIIRAGNPPDILIASMRIRRELQLSYFEKQKFQKPVTQNLMQNKNQKICSFCKKKGHVINECRLRQNQLPQNYSQIQNQKNFLPPNQFFQPRQNLPNSHNQFRPQNSNSLNQNLQKRPQPTNQQNSYFQQRNHHVNEETLDNTQLNENYYELQNNETYYYDPQVNQNYYSDQNFQSGLHSNDPPDSQEMDNLLTQMNSMNVTEQNFM